MSKTPTAERMPRVMVFRHCLEPVHSTWIDFMHRRRSRKSLEAMLRKMVRNGEIVAWRLMHIEKEVIGNDD